MTAIPFVGACFATVKEFVDYLDGVRFGAWRPRFVTMHHTGGPKLRERRGALDASRQSMASFKPSPDN